MAQSQNFWSLLCLFFSFSVCYIAAAAAPPSFYIKREKMFLSLFSFFQSNNWFSPPSAFFLVMTRILESPGSYNNVSFNIFQLWGLFDVRISNKIWKIQTTTLNKPEMNFNPNKHEFNKFYKKKLRREICMCRKVEIGAWKFWVRVSWRKISSQGYLEEKVTSRSTVKTRA